MKDFAKSPDEKKPPQKAAFSQISEDLLVSQIKMKLTSFVDELDQGLNSLAHDELSVFLMRCTASEER